jgi:hypothetical protein
MKIKNIYYNEIGWLECYKDISKKLTELKKIAREFYVDRCEHDVAMELARYSESDIKDMMAIVRLK